MSYNLLSNTGESFDSIRKSFVWDVPEKFNMAYAVCDKHADKMQDTALYYENESGEKASYTFGEIKRYSDQLANVLLGLGIEKGDRRGAGHGR